MGEKPEDVYMEHGGNPDHGLQQRQPDVNHLAKIILVAVLVVLAYDTLGALASRALGFPYETLVFGSYVIYGCAGFFAGRARGLVKGAIAGGLVGLIDATLGWAISWHLGPGHPPEGVTNALPLFVAFTVVFVSLLGAGLGLVGAAIGSFASERTTDAG